MRLRLKADGRIVELRDGQEFPLQPAMPPGEASAADLKSLTHSREDRAQALQIESGTRIMDLLVPITFRSPREGIAAMERGLRKVGTSPVEVRDLRRRAQLTQQEFAARLGVPVETIRNWEQGKRAPRGPARALLAVIAHSPEMVFAALAKG